MPPEPIPTSVEATKQALLPEARPHARAIAPGGVLGRLEKGGTFEVVQSEVAPKDWELSLLDVHITGRALFFHTIGQQQHEVRSQFKPVPLDLTVAEAASIAARDSKEAFALSRGSQ